MTDQEKNELNRKLAEWAGFTFETKGSGEKIGRLFEMDVVDGCEIVNYPDGGWDFVGDMPNFTDSLDACFEWLVPKFKRWEMGSNQDGEIFVTVCMAGQQFPSSATDKAPSLALCLAIEKLIEKT